MKIERWFKGSGVHDGQPTPFSETGPGMTDCLGSAVGWAKWREFDHLTRIIDRLFPARLCDCLCPAVQVVHFNNAPETTREDVDKVLLAYTEEVESERAG